MNKTTSQTVLVLAVIIAALYIGTNGFKSIGTTSLGSTTQTGSYTGAQTLRVGAGYTNYNKLGTPNTSVATTYYVYQGSSLNGQSAVDLETTSASGLSLTTNVVTPGPYVIVYGDNSHYLDTYTVVNVQPGVQATPAGVSIINYTAPTVTFGNGSVAYPTASSYAVFHGVSASSALVQPVMEIKGGSQNGGDAMGELAVVQYNSVAIAGQSLINIGCPGATQAPSAMLPTPTYIGGQNAQVGFIIPQTGHNQVVLCNPQISTTTGFPTQPASFNTLIGVTVYPITNYNLNGQWYPNVVVNPSTSAGTAIIAGVGSTVAYSVNSLA